MSLRRCFAPIAAVVAAVGLGAAAPAAAPAALAGLHDAANCAAAGARRSIWCLAADGWDAARPPGVLPAGVHVLLGVTVELQDGEPAAQAIASRVGLSALALRVEGSRTFARISTLRAGDEAENRAVAGAISSLSAALGDGRSGPIDPGLYQYVESLGPSAGSPVARTARGFTWTGAARAELRHVRDAEREAWVAIETPLSGPRGAWISVFTDRFVPAGPTPSTPPSTSPGL